jgi:microcin C transport system substrate-binding protein
MRHPRLKKIVLAALFWAAPLLYADEVVQCLSIFPESVCGLASLCGGLDPDMPEPPQGGQLVIGEVGYFDTFFPLTLKGDPAAGLGLVHASLFQHCSEQTGVFYPSVAREARLGQDRITFVLRDEACFSDGSPVTPEDVIATFEVMIKNHIPMPGYYNDVLKVEKTADHEVTFHLRPQASKEAMILVSSITVFSKKFLTNTDVEKNPLALPMGAGPYRVKSFVPGRSIIYEKIKNWWGKKLDIHRGSYNFQYIIYEYFRDKSILFEAFKAGKVDVLPENMAKNWALNYRFPSVKRGDVKKLETPHKRAVGHQAFIFNTRRDLFRDERVRKALSLMLDFDWMNKNLFYGSYRRTTSFFENTPFAARGLPSQEEQQILTSLNMPLPEHILDQPIESFVSSALSPRERVKKALELLGQGGWHLKKGQLYNAKGQPFVFTFLMTGTQLEKVALAFQRSLRKIGVTMQIRVMDTSQYAQRVRKQNFDMISGSMSYSDTPGNELVATCGSASADQPNTLNVSGMKDPAIDAVIEKVLGAQTLKDLTLYAHVLDRLIVARHYGIPNWYLSKTLYAYWNRFGRPHKASPNGENILQWWEVKPRGALGAY